MIKNRIKELREAKGLTVQELSEQVNIKASSISLQENLKRSVTIESALAYADFFNVSLDFLFYRDTQNSLFMKYKTAELEEFFDYLSEELKRRKKDNL